MFVISSILLFSCTDDTAETNSSNNKERVVADNPGDPINPATPPRPK